MSHAITIGDLVLVGGSVLVLVLALGGIVLLLTIMNPFRSGH